jgi:hypothetical protein
VNRSDRAASARRLHRCDRVVAEAIVSSGNLWMIKAVVSGGATAVIGRA